MADFQRNPNTGQHHTWGTRLFLPCRDTIFVERPIAKNVQAGKVLAQRRVKFDAGVFGPNNSATIQSYRGIRHFIQIYLLKTAVLTVLFLYRWICQPFIHSLFTI